MHTAYRALLFFPKSIFLGQVKSSVSEESLKKKCPIPSAARVMTITQYNKINR